MSPWVPRVLIVVAVVGIGAALISISVGEGGPGAAPRDIGGVNDVQRILGGIPQEGAYLGAEDAEVTITVFNDLQCGPCAEFQIETVDALVEEYARTDEARLEFRHFSLAPNEATLAALAAEAAGEQERQWQYIDTFVRNQDLAAEGGVTDELLRLVAEAVPQLELEQWEEELDGPGPEQEVRADAELANSLGLPAEPAIVVSGPGGQRELIQTPSLRAIEAAVEAVR